MRKREKSQRTIPVCVRLPKDTHDLLVEICKAGGATVSASICIAAKQYARRVLTALDRAEQDAWRDVQVTPEELKALEEARKHWKPGQP